MKLKENDKQETLFQNGGTSSMPFLCKIRYGCDNKLHPIKRLVEGQVDSYPKVLSTNLLAS